MAIYSARHFAEWLAKNYPDVYEEERSDEEHLFGLMEWVKKHYPKVVKEYLSTEVIPCVL